MKINKIIYFKTGNQWRKWLERSHDKAKEIWLVYYKKASGKTSVSYDDAVNEALCFGWIDSTVKKLDNERIVQRFTPRRKGSPMSPINKERARRLIRANKMTPTGLVHVGKLNEKFKVPSDILGAIQQNKEAWKNFKKFPAYYKKIRIAHIEQYRKHQPEMFKKSLANFIKKTAENEKFGMLK